MASNSDALLKRTEKGEGKGSRRYSTFLDSTFRVKRKTSGKKFKQKIKAMKTWIRFNRHLDQEALLKTIRSKLTGHYRYYGITDNYGKTRSFYILTVKLMFKWLKRRSQRRSFTWERYNEVLKDFRLPKPRIYVNL
ncbi:hypothetical protein [Cohnella silvisoli]|uniref:Group II intron maturase-specific domain-containing protein n=1 Tax=Cohnella silvisoli TaxID=2873699 RepID=A0ABV1KY16_9BACL|nr:hypothetical protein [Cohnella silvisoli]MCD9021861.1 hypothetical protein [Cohnella silvisoli]